MNSIAPVNLIIRHRRENKKKCSLEPIKTRSDCIFFNYPGCQLPSTENYYLLSFEGPLLSKKDANKGIILIDGTWKKAALMERQLFGEKKVVTRSLPRELITAYPRRQLDCQNPDQGLASIEALYAAYILLGRDPSGLLDGYFWRDHFLAINQKVWAESLF